MASIGTQELVPANSVMNFLASFTLIVKVPNDLTRTCLNSGSRIMIGLDVPHLRLVNSLVFTKNTSTLNGESNKYFHDLSVVVSGILLVVSFMPAWFVFIAKLAFVHQHSYLGFTYS